jgi:cell division transport system permease protein
MFSRIFSYSLKNIFRNKFLSVSSVLVLTLLVFFINLLLVIQNISFKIIDSVNEKLTVSLYLQDEYDKNSEPVRLLINSIRDLWNWIEVFYKTKDDVLEEIRKKDPELVRILERQNPLPETIELSSIPIESWDSVDSIIQWKIFLFSKEENKDIENQKAHFSEYNSQYSKIEKVTSYLIILRITMYVMIVLFLLSIWIIIYSIIWNFVFYYRDEIYITRLVWWSKIFIYWPFSLQWMLYAFASFLTGLALFYFLVQFTNFILKENYSLSFILWDYIYLFSLELLLLILIWGLSWLISSKKYLK